MNSPMTTDTAASTELTRLRQRVLELQRALIPSESRHQYLQTSALGAAQVGMWSWESETNRVSWSLQTEQIFGLPPGLFDGTYEGFLALVHPDDRQRLSEAIATAVTEQTCYLIEHRILMPSGETRWVASRGRTLCKDNGTVSTLVGTIEDITTRKQSELAQLAIQETLEARVRERTTGLERAVRDLKQEVERRQQAESALKASEQRYQSLYEQHPLMYFTLAFDGTVLSVNRFGADQLGYQKEDLIGQSIAEVFDSRDRQTAMERLAECTDNPYTLFDWEIRKIRKDGSGLWVKERARAIHDHTGIGIILVVCEDITDRKWAEATTRRSEDRLRLFLNALDDLAFEFDHDGRYLNVWTRNEDKLPFPKDELIGKHIVDVLGPESGAHYLEAIRRVITTQDTAKVDYSAVFNGTQHYFSGILTHIAGTGGDAGTVGCLMRDITESRRIESHVRENEARWRTLYEHAGVGIAQLSFDGRFLRVNPHLCALLGYTPDAMLQGNFQDFTHPDDIKTNLVYLTELLAGKRDSFSMEKRYRRVDHTWLWVNLTVSLVHADPGDQAYLIAVIQNIDDRKQSYSLLQAAMNSVTDGLLIVDRQGKVTSTNQRFLSLWNLPDGLAGCQNDDDLLDAVASQLQDPRAFLGKVRDLYAHPEAESFDILRFKDGRLFERHSRPQILEGEIVGRVWTFRDVTERKRAEEALCASERRLHRFVAEAPVGLCILDANWRTISTNRALCELTGYAEQEIIGSTYALYTHPEDLSAYIVLTDEFFRGIRSTYTYEKRYIRKSGEIVWVLVKGTRIELAGHDEPLLLTAVQDITERKLAMEEREQLSRDLHDNLLQALYAVGMQLEAGKLAMKHSARRSKTHMDQAIHQLNNLMVDVRRFIALLKKRTPTELDFGQALRQLTASMTGTAHTTTELDITNPVLSFVTPQLAEQLLSIAREALSNSLRHAHASRRWVRLNVAGSSIRLVVGDNGVGFSLTRRRRTGHGLSNMAARARRVSGTFALQSAPKRGTTITVDIPLHNGAVYE